MKPIYPLILCTIFGLSACSPSETDNAAAASTPDSAMRVNVVAVGKQAATPTLHLTGTVAAKEDVAVGTALSGLKILEVNADVGQRVEKGQVLARLDSVNVQAALRQSESKRQNPVALFETAGHRPALAQNHAGRRIGRAAAFRADGAAAAHRLRATKRHRQKHGVHHPAPQQHAEPDR